MGLRGGPQMQMVPPLTKMVKRLIIANVFCWIFLQIILESYVLSGQPITSLFGLVPELVVGRFFIWQPFTYMFLHSASDVGHIVFNLLLLWFMGADLEIRWGSKFFLIYYLVCGVGAAVLYTFVVLIYSLITGSVQPLLMPVVGASGALFGILLAYGIVFGERMVYFFFIFPMKAKVFVAIIGCIEVVMLLLSGIGGSRVANLAHLGGIASGFLFLTFYTKWQQRKRGGGSSKKGRAKLKLVVDNDSPKYWN